MGYGLKDADEKMCNQCFFVTIDLDLKVCPQCGAPFLDKVDPGQLSFAPPAPPKVQK